MTNPSKRIPVPHFRAILEERPELLKGLPKNTRSRYRNGEFPRAVRWLIERPELLRALICDSESPAIECQNTRSGA